MSEICLRANDVTKIYNLGKHNQVISVDKATLRVFNGTIVILKGPSGSGKTTLLSMLGCQVKPTSGEIVIENNKISKLPEKFANLYKRTHIGFIFQDFQLISDISVLDNIILPLLPIGVARKERKQRAESLLKEFDLENRRDFKIKELSGGEKQRVAIARALINGCRILLADEPTAHLDSKLTKIFLEYMGRLKEKGYTVLIASHDPAVFGHELVDKVYEMKDGGIIQ